MRRMLPQSKIHRATITTTADLTCLENPCSLVSLDSLDSTASATIQERASA